MARAATFTTYLNAQQDPGVDRVFNKFADSAVSRYATIAKAANQASKASAGLLGGNGAAAQASSVTRALTDRSTAITGMSRASDRAVTSSTALAGALRKENAEVTKAAQGHQALAKGLTTTAVALNVVQGPLGPLSGRISAVARAVTELTGVRLGLIGVGATLFTIARIGNDYQNFYNRVSSAFEGQTRINTALADITGIATRARTSLESVAGLYIRISQSAEAAGISQSRVVKITETAAKAAALSGGSKETQEKSLEQFVQTFGADFKGGGQEIQSILEGANQLGAAIAKGLGVPISALKKLGSEGKLSTAIVAAALEKSADEINARYARMAVTLDQSFALLGNSVEIMVGKLNQSTGFTSKLAGGIQFVADNLRGLTGVAIGFAAAFTGSKILPFFDALKSRITDSITQGRQLTTLFTDQIAQERAAATAAAKTAASNVVAIRAEIAEREADVVAIRATIGALQEERAQAVLNAQATAALSGIGGAGGAALAGDDAAARERAAIATRNLAQAEGELAQVEGALRLGKKDLAAAGETLEKAVIAEGEAAARVVPKFGLVTTALNGLKGAGLAIIDMFGGPWGIAIGAAAAALYLLATAESQAEAAARSNQEAQLSFAGAVDIATGKIYDQIGALQRLSLAKQQNDSFAENVNAAKGTRGNILANIANFGGNGSKALGQGGSPAEKELLSYVTAFQNNQRGSLGALEKALIRLAPAIDAQRAKTGQTGAFTGTLSGNLPQISADINQFRNQVLGAPGDPKSSLRSQAARARIIAGITRPGDLDLATGKVDQYTANGTGKPKSKAQINADAKAQAAQTDVERARANLAQVKANGPNAGESEGDYQTRLAGAYKAVTDAVNAQAAAKKAAAAGNAAAKKAARDAIQDEKDQAAATRDAALTALYASGQDPNSEAFIQERIKILKTYDDQVNKIDASAAASRSATAQMIQDAKDLAKASAERAEKRTGILANYDDNSKAVDKANAAEKSLQRMVGLAQDGIAFLDKTEAEIEDIKKENPLGTGIYTQAMADADKARIETGLRKPLTDVFRDSQRQLEINKLILQGRDAEAAALEKAFQFQDSIGSVSQTEYQALVKNEEQQLKINDALASRQRIVGTITNVLDNARDELTGFLTDLQAGANPDVGKLFKGIEASIFKVNAQRFTESIFAGADGRVRDLLSGKSKTDKAVDSFAETMARADSATDKIVEAFGRAADKIDAAADRIANAGTTAVAASPALVGGTTGNTIADALNGGNATDLKAIIGYTSAATASLFQNQHPDLVAANDNVDANGDIVVTGKRPGVEQSAFFPTLGNLPGKTPSGSAVAKAIFGGVFGGLDSIVDSLGGKKKQPDGTLTKDGVIATGSQFFKKIGDAFGGALDGAGKGAFASSIAKAVGIGQDSTGAAIGGAVGGFLNTLAPITAALGPFGAALAPVLGIVGGLVGNLFKTTPKSSAGISVNQFGELGASGVTGTDAKVTAQANSLAGAVAGGLQSIADQLGAKITGSTDVQIGTYKGAIRVNDHGGAIGGVSGSGAVGFGDDQEAAVAFAISAALQDGVLTGISQASINILKSGQDLQRALTKALAIESIPKQLLRLTDPVKAAVSDLNDQFSDLISYLKEGGATAQQFADAQKLYDLERAQAIKDATDQAASAIDDFLKEMLGGSSSPYNKKTVYDNASAEFDKFKGDIASGKQVDQNDLLTAARNFEDASRSLNGSSQSFFSDFDMLRSLLEKARDNAGMTDVTTLPGSPFADSSIQDIIAKVATDQAIKDQTATLSDKLDQVVDAVNAAAAGGGGASTPSAIDYLPGDFRTNKLYGTL